MKRKKDKYIAIFSAYIPPHVGGVERYVINLVKQFNKLGYKSIIVTSNYNNDKDIEKADFGVIIRLPMPRAQRLFLSPTEKASRCFLQVLRML